MMRSPGRGSNIERSNVKVAVTPNGDLFSILGQRLICPPSEKPDHGAVNPARAARF
jgi:hypothetical protein